MDLRTVIPVVAITLAGCDDLKVIAAYERSEIAEKAEMGFYNVGDSLFTDPEIAHVCIVARNVDLNEYVVNKREVIFSEDYYFIVILTEDGDESVERVHRSWLTLADGYTICTNDPKNVTVVKTHNKRIYIQLRG